MCVCVCACACVRTHVHMSEENKSQRTSSPMTNEGLLDKSAHVMLVPCSDMIGRTLALDSMYYTGNDIIITSQVYYINNKAIIMYSI